MDVNIKKSELISGGLKDLAILLTTTPSTATTFLASTCVASVLIETFQPRQAKSQLIFRVLSQIQGKGSSS